MTKEERIDTKLTALVIDDQDSIRRSERLLLEHAGFEVLTASDGLEGVKKFDQYSDQIDVVLMDKQMPRMDGYKACSAIKAIDPKTPVVLVTAEADSHPPEKFFDLGFSDFLCKPFNREELLHKAINCGFWGHGPGDLQ